MLTDLIVYDCIDYLLRDKTDEESLECLCKFLNTIGKELDLKTSDKVCSIDDEKKIMFLLFFFFYLLQKVSDLYIIKNL
jgi:hypothetical protein